MAETMMTLGDYVFSVDTAAFQKMNQTNQWRWASQERFGQGPALQYTGWDAPKISLAGTIHPFYRGGLTQLDDMRAQADLGVPLTLINAQGFILGDYCIEKLDSDNTEFTVGGAPQKVDFNMFLMRYDNDSGGSSATSNYTGPDAGNGPYVPGPTPGKSVTTQQTYISRLGDMLDNAIQDYYGAAASKLMTRVLENNRGLADLGAVLPVGTPVTFPPLPPSVSTQQLTKLWD